MANILLGVTGSVAAIKTPELVAQLRHDGHAVRIAATQAATYFFEPTDIATKDGRRDAQVITLDEDEWPGASEGGRWQRGDPVLHIELRRWADLFLIAPLDANTLAKLAAGLCDNCLTCVWRAWEPSRPVVLAPAMNTLMWEHPLTGRHFGELAAQFDMALPRELDGDQAVAFVNEHRGMLHIVPPVSKQLACGDVGVGAMAEVSAIAAAVEVMLKRKE